ncbi:ATP-binding cassette domain-containing protein [Microcoleus sp. AT9_A5]|uniref:ATP-binding cassette domain-containing protein n=1 Tax=Microcoleus sp. AT9_A5 TaxID=2818625 RepID=UPI0040408E12
MIEVEHLSKTYGSTAAIADVSFSVESGEILGFLGPNGAGKTTTMRILSGYLPASSGTARIAGMDVHENSMAVRQRIGYLPENPPLYPEMTVEGFLFFVARIKQVPAGDRARRVTSAIERCGLVDKRKVLIRKLSKGFRQRVGIAQAIVHDPPVIILDEPTVGLDPRQIIEVRNLIKSLGGQHTIILSTHILPEVSMTCNRVTIINRGKIVAAGSPENLMGELAAGEGYELEVEGEGDLVNSLLLPSLGNLRGVRSVELIPSNQFLVGRYRLRALCEPDIEPGREIATAILASGFGLCEMRRNRASLEDVFLRLTAAEKKPENLVHSEPEVDRNLQEAAETQESIADSHQSESQPIVENLQVSDRQESLYDSHSASEPVAETVELIEHPQPESEPVTETVELREHPQPESEPVAETVELREHPQPELEPVAETVELREHPQPELEPVAETVELIEHPQPELEPVAETVDLSGGKHLSLGVTGTRSSYSLQISKQASRMLTFVKNLFSKSERLPIEPSPPKPIVENVEVSETVESIEHSQPESEPVVETQESSDYSQPEPIVENLQVSDTVESIDYSQPESQPVAETSEEISDLEPEMQPVADFLEIVEKQESLKNPQPESVVENLLIVETQESSQPSQPEPVVENLLIVETQESSDNPQPEPIVENLLIVETQESSEHSQPEPIVENLQVSDIVESSDYSQPEPVVENLLIVETVESLEHSQPEPIVQNLEVSETVESLENSQPEPLVENLEVSETVESSEHPQLEPIVENLLIVQMVESSDYSQPEPEPIFDAPKSSELSQPESQPILDAPKSSELSQPESQPILDAPKSSELSQPESQQLVKNRPLKKKPQPSSDSRIEQSPMTKKRQIERKQKDSNDSETPPAGNSE